MYMYICCIYEVWKLGEFVIKKQAIQVTCKILVSTVTIILAYRFSSLITADRSVTSTVNVLKRHCQDEQTVPEETKSVVILSDY